MADSVLPIRDRFDGYYELLEADRQWLDGEVEHLNTLAKRTIAERPNPIKPHRRLTGKLTPC